jgi:hypothetical protein
MELLDDPILVGGTIVLLGLFSGWAGFFGFKQAVSPKGMLYRTAWLWSGAVLFVVGTVLAFSGLLVLIGTLSLFA